MRVLGSHRTGDMGRGLRALGALRTSLHCHHFNLFFEQTIDDALGPVRGFALRRDVAQECAHAMFAQFEDEQATPALRLLWAQAVFAELGYGTVDIAVDDEGLGTATGAHLHHGTAWFEKYGALVRRREPADAVAAGFIAAAVEFAFGLSPGSRVAHETACVAKRSARCAFAIEADTRPLTPVVPDVEHAAPARAPAGLHEDRIRTYAEALHAFCLSLAGDARGMIQGFGVLVTLQPVAYNCRAAFRALELVRAEKPGAVGVFEDLLRESAQVCVYFTFGGILASPEFEGLVGAAPRTPEDIVVGALAIARALGFGRWRLEAFEPHASVQLASPDTYESAFMRAHDPENREAVCFLFQGAAAGIMQLAHRVDWENGPRLTQKGYDRLFRSGPQWQTRETCCSAAGDAECGVVAERRA